MNQQIKITCVCGCVVDRVVVVVVVVVVKVERRRSDKENDATNKKNS